MAVDGDYAYCAFAYGLVVLDVSVPANPSPVSRLYLTVDGSLAGSDAAVAVRLSGNHALIANGYAGLYVVDISDATTPDLVGRYDTPGRAGDEGVGRLCVHRRRVARAPRG